ncbi:MAG TPA: hypothetical protein VFG04_03875 [Planctomycetaceae bacterium]|jgi:hypothetical protein|nr:hypothetical protein [Planctomycetaceae bacterium]
MDRSAMFRRWHRRRMTEDYYATDPPVTEALLSVEEFEGQIWEPCCGEGWMSDVLLAHGYDVLSTDLIDRGYGTGGVNFLEQYRRVPNIVTNPPYIDNRHRSIVVHALNLAERKVAMLLTASMLSDRYFIRLLAASPLKAIYFLDFRVYTFRDGDRDWPSLNWSMAWVVWDKQYTGLPFVKFIRG